jgi:transcription antitermination factor NusG
MSAFSGAGQVYLREPNWYAVYTRHSHEKRAGDHFASRDIEFFLPSYRTMSHWRNRCKVEVERPLFPTYIFVRIAWREYVRILEVPSVISIVGNGRQPLPLPQAEIETLRSGLKLANAQPHPYLNVGERVRIKSGLLAGMEGVVLRMGNALRVVLTIEQIGKSIVVEVDQSDMEAICWTPQSTQHRRASGLGQLQHA